VDLDLARAIMSHLVDGILLSSNNNYDVNGEGTGGKDAVAAAGVPRARQDEGRSSRGVKLGKKHCPPPPTK
jgi:hypothetical protein